jgi:hypothetical protein
VVVEWVFGNQIPPRLDRQGQCSLGSNFISSFPVSAARGNGVAWPSGPALLTERL